jgi:hypothetical protein
MYRQSESDFLKGLKRYGMTGRSFTVVDENGDTHTIRAAWRTDDTRGVVALMTDKGMSANRISKGVYTLSDGVTTLRATSDDPDAP